MASRECEYGSTSTFIKKTNEKAQGRILNIKQDI
jgi:hypothetical protein